MNRYASWGFALALLPIAACSNNSQTVSTPPSPPPSALADADAAFANSVIDQGMFQTQVAPYEAQNGSRAAIKGYASQLADAYTRNLAQIQSTVASKTYTAPASLSTDMQGLAGGVTSLHGTALDRAFLNAEVRSLSASVQAYQAEVANGQDPDLKSLAQTNLPTVQRQLARARALGGSGGTAARATTARRHHAGTR